MPFADSLSIDSQRLLCCNWYVWVRPTNVRFNSSAERDISLSPLAFSRLKRIWNDNWPRTTASDTRYTLPPTHANPHSSFASRAMYRSHVKAEAPNKTNIASITASTRTTLEYLWHAISRSFGPDTGYPNKKKCSQSEKQRTWWNMDHAMPSVAPSVTTIVPPLLPPSSLSHTPPCSQFGETYLGEEV